MFNELWRITQAHWGNPSVASHPLWRPAVDVHRTAHGWLIKMELAGVRPEEIQIQTCKQSIIVRGVRRDTQQTECDQCYSLEIAYSQFEREISLPCLLEKTQISTDYRDGMLLIQIVLPEHES